MSASLKDVKNKLKGYRHADQAARDVQALIANFTALKVQDVNNFVHSNGATEKLASVTGTIPVKIRGSTYNIPVAIWLKQAHPHYPPIVYVTPTPGMAIQPSQFVDTNGIVYLPYLSDWKIGSSDLTALAQIMCATFADRCPVYSKPAQWQPPQPVQPPTSYRSPNPYPSGYPPPQAQPPQQPYPGYPTPYPPGGAQMPTPYSSYQQTPPTSSVAPAQPPPYSAEPPTHQRLS
jgi:ESCRT-I complex subunit TSG101